MRVLIIVVAAWVITFVVGSLVLVPNTDDVYYALPAVGLASNGYLAVPVAADQSWPVQFNFPTYSLFQGVVFKVLEGLGVPVVFGTYRVGHILTVAALLIVAGLFLNCVSRAENANRFYLPVLFAGALGLLPFGQAWPLFRPEPLGLLCIVGGTWLLLHRGRGAGWLPAIIGGVVLGVSPTLHPVFAFVSASLVLVFAYRRFCDGKPWQSLGLLGVSALPLTILFAYLIVFRADSFQIILGQTPAAAAARSLLLGVVYRAIPVLDQEVGLRAITSFVFFMPWLVLLILSSLLLVRRLVWRWRLSETSGNDGPFLVILAASTFSMLVFIDFLYVHSVLAVLILLSVLALEHHRIGSCVASLPAMTRRPLLVLVALAPLVWPGFNLGKHFVNVGGAFLYPPHTLATLRNLDNPGDPVFLAVEELVPLIIEEIRAPGNQSTFWLLPSAGQVLNRAEDLAWDMWFLERYVLGKGGYWLVRSSDLQGQRGCVSIPNTPHEIGLEGVTVIQKHRRFALIRSENSTKFCG